MKRLNRKEEAVSPVIATILMVAITVVLAATLYMMVGDIGGETTEPLGMSLSEESTGTDNVTLGLSMTTPSSADMDDVTVAAFDANGSNVVDVPGLVYEDDRNNDEDAYVTYRGPGADDDEITDGARLRVNFDTEDYDGYTVEVSVDGYSGQASIEL